MDLYFLKNLDISDVISELSDPAEYRGYLKTMSHFSSYSWRNIFLIFKQMPHATKLADFDTWKDKYKRKINQGATSIKINVPVEQKPKKKFVEKIDPSTGAAALDENGKRIMEEILIESPVTFKQSSYFDISQTNGNPVPCLAGDVMADEALRGVFTDVLKIMASFSAKPFDYYDAVKQIVFERLTGFEKTDDFIIDSITFVVCHRFGVDVGNIVFDVRIDAETLEIIGKQADGIITAIEDKFAILCKERGLDPMTLTKPQVEPEAVNTAEVQTHKIPQYTKELRTETVAGITFNQYTVKPLTALEPAIPVPPPATAIKQPAPAPAEPPTLKHPPDTSITVAERNAYGYTRPELLPLNKDRAAALFMRDMIIYLLHKDNTETMARYMPDILNHDGIFGVAYGAWLNDREYIALASGKPEDRMEANFIFYNGDSFAIYQTEPDNSPNAYKSYEEIEKHGLDINRRNYNLVYTAPLPPSSDTPTGLFMWVNGEQLDDYNGRALAVSDVLSIKKDEIITSHYANGRTFKELLSFMGEEGRKYRRRLEMEAAEKAAVVAEQSATQEIGQEVQKHDAVVPTANEPPQTQPQAESPAIPLETTATTETPQSAEPPATAHEKQPAAEPPAIQTPPPNTAPPALPVNLPDEPLYRLSAEDAESHGVTQIYQQSIRIDVACAEFIDKAIQTHKEGENSYGLAASAKMLLKEYGNERVTWVLSKHIRAKPKGFSEANRSWAEDCLNGETGSGDAIPVFVINTHNIVLDALVKEIRVIISQKQSFNRLMRTAKQKSDAHNKSNS